MRRALSVVTAVTLAFTACVGGGGSAQTTILVDFSHDEFPSWFIRFFPAAVTARQGDTLVFKQTWTGEPHTVTGGKLTDKLGQLMRPYLNELAETGSPGLDEAPANVEKEMAKLPFALGEKVNQTVAQPCYLKSGKVPTNEKPCRTQQQPEFDGTYAYYNSGIIPYEGPQGNSFSVKLADDIDPGRYFFYCAVHGPLQATEVTVESSDADVPSAEEVSRQARKEINVMSEPLVRLFRDATDGDITLKGFGNKDFEVSGNFAGLWDPRVEGAINEFVPRRFSARAGEPIVWNMIGLHTITFGVPEYFPILTFGRNGTVERNPKLDPPAGGANEFDLSEEERYERGEPVAFDGGTYVGSGFWSSGTMDAEPYIRYRMRITRPGTYKYACLIHTPLFGTVEVT